MANHILTFPCPHCKQQVRVKPPQKSGIYKITCPHCQYKANLKLPGADSINMPQQGAAPRAASPQPPIPQMPPRPQMPQMQPQPQMPGMQQQPARPQMPVRQVPIPQMPPQQQTDPTHTFAVNRGAAAFGGLPQSRGQAKLERLGKMFNDSYPLRPGITTVGRYDDAVNSDIAVKGDTYMSRRSVSIDMAYDNMRGFTYRLRVLNTTNPVLLNGQNVPVGAEAFLNFGDVITLGRTQFRLDPMK